MKRFDVVVVGAGPGGSATAALLAARGCSVALLDRAAFPRPKPCAEYVGPGAVRILDRLGVLGRLRAQPHAPIRGMRVTCGDAAFEGRFDHGEEGLGVSRRALDASLVEAAAGRGVVLHERATVEEVALGGTDSVGIAARTPGGPIRLEARLLVGADGLNSRVARRLGVARRGTTRRVALVTHAADVPGMGDVGEMHVTGSGYVGLAPLGNRETNVALVMDLSRETPGGPPDALLRRQLERFPAVKPRLGAGPWVDEVRAVGPFASRARRASDRRVVLVGDAADFHDPFTGEGVYAALRGAELIEQVVTPLLQHDRLAAGDLRVYDRARRRAFADRWAFERLVSWAIARPALFAQVARVLSGHPSLADRVVRQTGHAAA